MRLIFTFIFLAALSNTAIAEKKYYYFAKSIDGVFRHTYVLRCITPQVTDTVFNSEDMAGPFNDARVAEDELQQVISVVKQQGGKVLLSLGRCLEQ